MKIFDTFMVNQDFDVLECRLYELEGIPNLVHVAVEADVDHQDHPKPYHLTENLARFERWADRLRVVRATGLPSRAEFPDPWARERAQREFATQAMQDATGEDVILHGDVDEIPRPVAARNMRPSGMVTFQQTGHFWSLRWRYPHPWPGTVAARVGSITCLNQMRDARNFARPLRNAGWHLSWLGGADKAIAKVGSFCHPEVEDRIRKGLDSDMFLRDGVHVDGVRMARCEVDATFPRWVRDGLCPASWLV